MYYNYSKTSYAHDFDFYEECPKGGMTYAYKMIPVDGNLLLFVGISYCSRNDFFDRKKGRETAEHHLEQMMTEYMQNKSKELHTTLFNGGVLVTGCVLDFSYVGERVLRDEVIPNTVSNIISSVNKSKAE